MCNCILNSSTLALARESLRAAMARAGWDFETIADAELALAELVVNAWRHGRTSSPVVLVLILGRTLRVSVSDDSTEFPEQREPCEFAESGRGLRLVQGLTHRWGTEPRKHGKSVWFELDAAA